MVEHARGRRGELGKILAPENRLAQQPALALEESGRNARAKGARHMDLVQPSAMSPSHMSNSRPDLSRGVPSTIILPPVVASMGRTEAKSSCPPSGRLCVSSRSTRLAVSPRTVPGSPGRLSSREPLGSSIDNRLSVGKLASGIALTMAALASLNSSPLCRCVGLMHSAVRPSPSTT